MTSRCDSVKNVVVDDIDVVGFVVGLGNVDVIVVRVDGVVDNVDLMIA